MIVIMGGAIGQGNMSPAAEFNILFDPVAYERVLQNKGSIPLVMIPLEVTHEVRAKEPIFNFLRRYKEIPMAQALLSML